MKIRMLTGISGPSINLNPKDETDAFSAGEALRLMLSDQAEPVDEEAETALASARKPGGQASSAVPVTTRPVAPIPPARGAKPLTEQNVEELRDTAEAEGIRLHNFLRDPAKIVAAIEAARAAKG